MDLSQLHFAHPPWFWTLLIIPAIWGLFFFYYQKQEPIHQLEKFIDRHLLPYLLLKGGHKEKKVWTHLLLWSLVWSCLVLALAGPRWNFREITTFTRDQNLAILLDLSESMNAKDILPSRLGRAKHKIEDLLNMSKGVKVGLIAFAADPHMIVPMTEDKEMIRHLLPSLDTDLVYVQGSKLAPALEMAATMFENEPGNNRAIIVISDGGFEDASALHTAKKLAEKGIVLYTIGVGSLEGAPLKDRQGVVVKKNGSAVMSKLEKEKFREISKIGHGRYFDADHSEQIALIFEDLAKRSDVQQKAHHLQRFWEEHFYLFLLPVIPFFLWWYRRGYLVALLLLSFAPVYSADLKDCFYNTEQQAGRAYEQKDYTAAGDTFQDPYRKGVAYYRVGDYKAAEELFRQSTRPEVACSAAYNLGNALVQQNKLNDAITAYEDVLKKWPDHKHAKENLELVKKMLEEEKQDQEKQQDKEKQSEEQSEKEKKNDESKESADSEKPSEEKELPKDQADEQIASAQQNENQNPRSQEDLDADLWLDQIKNDPKAFLKNKFYLESKKNGTKEEVDPW